jgi:MFS family permease
VSTILVAAVEPSKLAFYVCGGLFVGWAVVLAAVGLTVPEFPFGRLGQRAVMLVSLVLAAAAIATAIATSK